MSHDADSAQWLLAAPLLLAAVAYLAALPAVRSAGRWWPAWRAVCWVAGVVAAGVALTGPLAGGGFVIHTVDHLLLGMIAPLLLVAGAPVTLALRALPVRRARSLARFLACRPMGFMAHPVTAVLLDAGGLWLMYTTVLFAAMIEHNAIRLVAEAHMLGAGYLFTAAMIGVDPAPHRPGRLARAVVLVAFLAGHAILARYLYGHPPAGVSVAGARAGAELMYYGGDLADLVLVAVFCRQWYVATDPRRAARAAVPSTGPRRLWRLPDELRTGGQAIAAPAGPGQRISRTRE
jgi:putative membrane protein